MGNINRKYIEDYIRSLIPNKKDFISEIGQYALENNVPIVHPEVAQLLKVLVRMNKPKRILEVGTAIGYSALVMAKCMNDGEIVTIERNDDMIKIAEDNIQKNGFKDRIKIIKGDAEDVLKNIDGKFDFIFLDASKGHYKDFFFYFIDKLTEGGVVVSDNILFKGMVATDELVIRRKKTIVKRMRDYLEFISNNESLETSIIPIGDGVAISYKKEDA
ncbi:O-methyltransferase YrrM [Gottschalkia acidurici 9a]|uniref:tRNA 5-hydroxyuridine methyltransferase n=1 Tax=Gottschalkia acidurici (strain ATCC 7906 / DSM 604 / BCRC 14475 / CIP 104303 / KCTC 5404 / NCIMB 10678 / 9a) TaxID=1128398 RepID=K0B084_GOTA9|nr:O-methyltransferase [Gottschalkia acidurici]AFS78355.1 O-methyltransferase YrrM [Gottschalkia acidurici 9a]